MKRMFLMLLVLLAALSVSAVAADENATDMLNASDVSLQEDAEILPDDDDVLEVEKNASMIESSKVKGYESFKTTISLKLTSNDKPLASKTVSILINGVTYKRTTDKNGEALLSLKLKTGTYMARFTYDGDNSTNGTTGKCKVVINDPIKTSLKVGDKYIYYRQGSKCLFYVILLNKNGKAIKNQIVKIRVAGKTYKVKTDSKGHAKVYLKLKKGKRTVKYSFYRTSPYLSSSGKHVIKVHSKISKGNGYWLWPMHMKSVNLKSLASKGTKHIFLHAQSLSTHGRSSVTSFIKRAHSYGMKVHLWMQVFCVGEKWVSPVRDDGSLKYGFMNNKINLAKSYARIPGVDGIHFDYIRYGGTAHIHKNAVKSINYFVKKASTQLHKVNPNCIVSAAIMPEPSMMTYYYGQDVPTMSRYMDVLVPMVYKGNYHQTRSWVTSVTKTYVDQSSGAQIWTGLQSYYSDNNARKLPQSVLVKDSKAAMKGGAKGIILFRIGISCNFDFRKV